jgi:hypothetical protein
LQRKDELPAAGWVRARVRIRTAATVARFLARAVAATVARFLARAVAATVARFLARAVAATAAGP